MIADGEGVSTRDGVCWKLAIAKFGSTHLRGVCGLLEPPGAQFAVVGFPPLKLRCEWALLRTRFTPADG